MVRVTPKYNVRYADDWVILTSTEREAERLKRELTKYFRYRMKLELSQEKTKVTDMRKEGIHFLGFIIKAEKPRKTLGSNKDWLVGKPFPDKERLTPKKSGTYANKYETCAYIRQRTAEPQKYTV